VDSRFRLSVTDQRSVGDDLLTGSDFDTQLVTGYVMASYLGFIATLGGSSNLGNFEVQRPFSSQPGPLGLMIEDFNSRDEDAWSLSTSYNFRRVGLEGLSAVVKYAKGYNAKEDDGSSKPDEYEINVTVDYKVQRGVLRGLWLRLRGAQTRERSGGGTDTQIRVILNYELPLL
jgi:hypothetical protein